MTKSITFRMAAWSDAAGKYDPSAPLNGNEDNFYVDDDLSDALSSHNVADEDTILTDCGIIMAVADGMGGMNAGEVASQIAHDTVAEFFAPGKITSQLAATHERRSKYMEKVISEADRRIKKDAHSNRAHEGMGSTLIMAWLVGNELSVTWIGDSRAYRFNPYRGIEPLSKDHSYVQELADKGIITYEQTFEHPQGNIVTRSLGDESKKAKAESRIFKVYNGDIILLCSDGLSGVLRDRKAHDENGIPYQGDNIEDIIRAHSTSLTECRKALCAAAEAADWYDNVTIILCEIRSGAELNSSAEEYTLHNALDIKENNEGKSYDGLVIKVSKKALILLVFLLLLVIFLLGSGIWYKKHINNSLNITKQSEEQIATDSTISNDTINKVAKVQTEYEFKDSIQAKNKNNEKKSVNKKEKKSIDSDTTKANVKKEKTEDQLYLIKKGNKNEYGRDTTKRGN